VDGEGVPVERLTALGHQAQALGLLTYYVGRRHPVLGGERGKIAAYLREWADEIDGDTV
jgi:hypothetical protein